MTIRLGITMRVVENAAYPETRDAISHDWIRFINAAIPDAIVVPIVNNPECAVRLLQSQLDGVVLSSGEDVGSVPVRDEAELVVIKECLRRNIPVFGACRGLQMINCFFGGMLVPDLEKVCGVSHVGQNNNLDIVASPFKSLELPSKIEVNSFHRNGVMQDGLGKGLKAFALSSDGVVEGLFHKEYPMIAVQWHPERQSPSGAVDEQLVKFFFGVN